MGLNVIMKICTIDIGGTFIKAALMNEHAEIMEKKKYPADSAKLDILKAKITEIISSYEQEIEGVALCCPGKVDCNNGIVYGSPLSDFYEFDIVDFIRKYYGLRSTVNNDGKCAALAEKWRGSLKDVENGMVYILGTGIGGGIIINGNLYSGSNFSSGELSGVLIDIAKSLDVGNLMASQLSISGMLNRYSQLSDDEVDGHDFFKKIGENNFDAIRVLEEMTSKTAAYLYNIQSILDFERIAIGGGISEQPLLLKLIKEKYHEFYTNKFPLPCSEAEIVKCTFGNDANLIGAMRWYMGKTCISHR